ncbi:RimK/LysX family protein [Aliivibrio sp. S3MY1]|uniref:ATP-dependent zinc protease family protein n=1 Tax=unclassified Aliivibrio TaxID=2645654 RepID=UPI0023799D8F|nr:MULTISPECIES: RimK/LysX family protein [unclassified Aliivibrio]MDD9194363.1 RimK/LysX family protein [Aliivibrio sp. S3MY1]MDD9198031.1 RimK/LysX family protein [Aliivibrio sp. S2MY1]
MKKLILSTCLLLLSTSSFAAESCSNKTIVGQIETIHVKELGSNYEARIDTGAATTSIHATNIEIIGKNDESEDMRDHLGDTVKFTTYNEVGEASEHTGRIIKVSKIRNAQGVERRYAVQMHLEFDGKDKKIAVNLRDRSKLDYKLLIGRNWLAGDYLVDVEKNAE